MNVKSYILIIVNDHNDNTVSFFTLSSKYLKEFPNLLSRLENSDSFSYIDNLPYISIDEDYIPCNYIGSGECSMVDVKGQISKVVYYNHY